jgi:hypothetical protein
MKPSQWPFQRRNRAFHAPSTRGVECECIPLGAALKVRTQLEADREITGGVSLQVPCERDAIGRPTAGKDKSIEGSRCVTREVCVLAAVKMPARVRASQTPDYRPMTTAGRQILGRQRPESATPIRDSPPCRSHL